MARPLLADKISNRILTEFGRDQTLPSERELADRYSCNRLTVRKALKLLGDAGLAAAVPRNGHFLTESGRQEASRAPVMTNIVLFSLEDRLKDPAHMYMIGGAVHQARLNRVNLIVKEIANTAALSGFPPLSELHPGVKADGYIIAGAAPLAFFEHLREAGKPCVMLGFFYEQMRRQQLKPACPQLVLSAAHVYNQVGRHLRELGHRKIMLATSYEGSDEIVGALQSAFAGCDVEIDTEKRELARSERSIDNLRQAATAVVKGLDGHTALVIPEGHIFALEVFRQLQAAGIRVPEDLSVIIQGCETDWFLNAYDITCVYADYRDQGIACVRELLRILEEGHSDCGIRYTPAQFIIRSSTGRPGNAYETKVTRTVSEYVIG